MYFLNLGGDTNTIGYIYIYITELNPFPNLALEGSTYPFIEALVDNWIYSFCGLCFAILHFTGNI